MAETERLNQLRDTIDFSFIWFGKTPSKAKRWIVKNSRQIKLTAVLLMIILMLNG